MSMFITRVELHDATSQDYEALHTEMEKEGFSRTIVNEDNVTYHLPTAEYYKNGAYTSEKVCKSAKSAVEKTGKDCWILTSECSSIKWILKKVVTN